MPTSARRSKLLPAMLISLGIAAAAGVAGVLVPDRDVIGQVVLMAILTAIGCGLVMVAARFLDKRENRLAAQAAIALIVVAYLLSLMLTWDAATRFLGLSGEDAVGQALFFVFAAGIPMIVMCRLLRTAWAHAAGISGVILIGTAAVVMLIGAMAPGISYHASGNIAAYGGWIEAFSFPIVACLVGLEIDPKRWLLFRFIGVGGGIFALGSLLFTLMIDKEFDPGIWFAIEAAICVFVGHFNLARRTPAAAGMAWIRLITVLAVATTGILSVCLVAAEKANDYVNEDIFERLIAASGICAGCGTVALAIIAWMNRKTERVMVAPADLHEIQLQCPGCQTKQTLPLGDGVCSECGLRFMIKIDEPRCESCGYLLYRLKSDRCPECGTPMNTGMTNVETRMTKEIRMSNS